MMHNVGRLMAMVVTVMLVGSTPSEAVTNYSGDQAAFDAAVAALGVPPYLITFETLSLGDPIADQYSPPVSFSTEPGYHILANGDAWATPALDENGISDPTGNSRCAQIDVDASWFQMSFDEPVYGASFWVLDVFTNVSVTVFGENGILLDFSIPISGPQAHTFVGVLSDVEEIVRIKTQPGTDPSGFDHVTVVPEPTTLSLLALGGLAFLRRRCEAALKVSMSNRDRLGGRSRFLFAQGVKATGK